MTDPRHTALDVPEGKPGACSIVRMLLERGACASCWELPGIRNWMTAVPLSTGIADFLLFHHDDSVTVVVVAGEQSRDDVARELGPLVAHGAAIAQCLERAKVRLVLAAPVAGRSAGLLHQLCELAGICFEPLGPLAEHRAVVAARGNGR